MTVLSPRRSWRGNGLRICPFQKTSLKDDEMMTLPAGFFVDPRRAALIQKKAEMSGTGRHNKGVQRLGSQTISGHCSTSPMTRLSELSTPSSSRLRSSGPPLWSSRVCGCHYAKPSPSHPFTRSHSPSYSTPRAEAAPRLVPNENETPTKWPQTKDHEGPFEVLQVSPGVLHYI